MYRSTTLLFYSILLQKSAINQKFLACVNICCLVCPAKQFKSLWSDIFYVYIKFFRNRFDWYRWSLTYKHNWAQNFDRKSLQLLSKVPMSLPCSITAIWALPISKWLCGGGPRGPRTSRHVGICCGLEDVGCLGPLARRPSPATPHLPFHYLTLFSMWAPFSQWLRLEKESSKLSWEWWYSLASSLESTSFACILLSEEKNLQGF